MQSSVEDSLYDRIGGEAAIMAAVGIFYDKVIADDRVRSFFEGLDMNKQTQKMISFMAWAFGGPSEFRGRDLRIAHAPLLERGLNDVHFDVIASHLADTLRELEVSDAVAKEVLALVGGTRKEVLGR